MEVQNRIKTTSREPGRRYTTGLLHPRAGADIMHSAPSQAVDSAPSPVKLGHDSKAARTPARAKPALPRTAKSIVLRRQMVAHAKQHKHQVRRSLGKHLVSTLIVLVMVLSLGTIVWAFRDLVPFKAPFLQKKNSATVMEEPKLVEQTDLDESVPTPKDIASYVMAVDAPRILRVPSLDIESRVRRVGTALSGEPIAPSNIYDIGWFEVNGKPNEANAVLLNGHSFGPTKTGIFARLNELKPGDKILIEMGDKSVITYAVSQVEEYQANQLDMSVATQSINPAKKGLNLMMTNSRYSSRSTTPFKQLIVFTIQQ